MTMEVYIDGENVIKFLEGEVVTCFGASASSYKFIVNVDEVEYQPHPKAKHLFRIKRIIK